MRKKRVLSVLIFLILTLSVIAIFEGKGVVNSERRSVQEGENSTDLQLVMSKNSSGISPDSIVEFKLNVTNTLSEVVNNVELSVEASNDNIYFTPSSDPMYDLTSMNPGELQTLTFSANLVESTAAYTSADLVLIIDASGSMGGEIESVKNKLNLIIENFTTEMNDPRIGVIVHGWSRYSQYPTESTHNYIKLTADYDSVKTFVNGLDASGGTEPWGDALYLADTWEWRENAAKLIVMVGDEDCDPGKIIGVDSENPSYYNGSELVNVVKNLKDKGVIINTVISAGYDSMTQNQFGWIAKFTDGKSVYLPDLEEQQIDLPDLIVEWTLELVREFSIDFNVTVSWEKLDSSKYFNILSDFIWLDLAPPSIILSSVAKIVSLTNFNISIFADVRDISPIKQVVLYHDINDYWVTEEMIKLENKTVYKFDLSNVNRDENISYFVEAIDVHGNTKTSSEKWVVARVPTYTLGELPSVVLSTNDYFFSQLNTLTSDDYYLFLSGPKSIENLSVSLTDDSENIKQPKNQILIKSDNSTYRRIFVFDLGINDWFLNISSTNMFESVIFNQVWIKLEDFSSSPERNDMTESIRVQGYSIQTDKENHSAVINYTPYSPLSVNGEVLHTNLSLLGKISVYDYYNLTKGETYIVIIWANLRDGYYELAVLPTDEIGEVTDRYYDAASASPGFSFIELFIFVIPLTYIYKKRKK